ncbi:DNA/RNA non-specific endonuclease, partial [Ensifer aridi]|uniref:DNA/RNA non-specific endonuclease n=1 Tax=Ensifer aridi TaxID=1708715 RepID=UPI0015E45384
VKVPTAFWKIAAYENGGALRAHGFMLWQEEEVADLDERFEGTIDLSMAKRPVKIREIARLTGLDFGPLFDADVRGGIA